MFIIGLIGAIVFGGAMGYAHVQAQKGANWAQPVEVVGGIGAIICALLAVYANLFGPTDAQKTSWAWAKVRGRGTGEWINTEMSGKRLLIVRNKPWNGQKDYQFENMVAQLKGFEYKVFEIEPELTSIDPESGMLENVFWQKISPSAKKTLVEYAKKFSDAISAEVKPGDYDAVVFCANVADFLYMEKKGPKFNPFDPIAAFKGKQLFFLYQPAYQYVELFMKNNPSILGYVNDKALKSADDYEKGPSGSQQTDFDARYEIKKNKAAKK